MMKLKKTKYIVKRHSIYIVISGNYEKMPRKNLHHIFPKIVDKDTELDEGIPEIDLLSCQKISECIDKNLFGL
jgi:hypothetical protein